MADVSRKGDAPSVQLEASARVIKRCREIKRMNSVIEKDGMPQLRCVPLPGNPASFRYEVNVQGGWVPSNYQFAAWVVGNSDWLVKPRGRCG